MNDSNMTKNPQLSCYRHFPHITICLMLSDQNENPKCAREERLCLKLGTEMDVLASDLTFVSLLISDKVLER